MVELVSIHIPKTAGRSFVEILKAVYGENRVRHFDRKDYSDKSVPEVLQFISGLTESTTVIHGHFTYNDIRDIKNIHSAKLITWVRDPVERVFSNYSFFKKRIAEASEESELQKRKEETLIEYASLEHSRNRMSKFISGARLKDFFFIGVIEYFDSDIKTLSDMLGWPEISIPRVNINSEFKSKLPAVSENEKKVIRELNKDDVELYNNVLESTGKKIN
jgi:hypothetical protein